MGELVKYIAINLVDKPEEVKVVEKQGDHATIIELTVAPDDMGKAIRTVVKAASIRENKKYIVEIV